MEKLKVGKHGFTFAKLTRKDRKILLKKGIDLNALSYESMDTCMDEVFKICLLEKDDHEADKLSMGDEEKLFEGIIKISRGVLLSDSEKN